jgi:hypothetical protein
MPPPKLDAHRWILFDGESQTSLAKPVAALFSGEGCVDASRLLSALTVEIPTLAVVPPLEDSPANSPPPLLLATCACAAASVRGRSHRRHRWGSFGAREERLRGSRGNKP